MFGYRSISNFSGKLKGKFGVFGGGTKSKDKGETSTAEETDESPPGRMRTGAPPTLRPGILKSKEKDGGGYAVIK